MEIWPSDLDYGIIGHTYDGQVIGGTIKNQPEDFIVTEIDPETSQPIAFPPEKMINKVSQEGGLFLIGRAWKRGIDHGRMIHLIAKQFGVKEPDISTSGIKDANAITVQLFSVYQPSKKVNDPLQIAPGLEIDSFRRAREYLWPGAMGGNKFEIIIKNISKIKQEDLDNFGDTLSGGLLNYYGYQRFGSNRPITAQFGRLLANSKYKDAIDLYLGGKSANLEDDQFRKRWRDTQNPDELLLNWKNIPIIEKIVLKYLAKRPNDYSGAIRCFPDYLIKIAKSSFIALLTNHYLSRRGLDTNLLPGERINNDNIEIALPSRRWKQPLNDIWSEVFDYVKLGHNELKNIRHTSRLLKVKPTNWRADILSNDKVKVSFHLPNGAYATIVLRELMQKPPSAFF